MMLDKKNLLHTVRSLFCWERLNSLRAANKIAMTMEFGLGAWHILCILENVGRIQLHGWIRYIQRYFRKSRRVQKNSAENIQKYHAVSCVQLSVDMPVLSRVAGSIPHSLVHSYSHLYNRNVGKIHRKHMK